ncbi:MAG: DNA alkylation repair protein [Candidatus Zixiibacteriota bacterium]
MKYTEVLKRLKSMANPDALEGMARYGITATKSNGVSAPKLRTLAKEIGKNHELALKLFGAGILDARLLAALIDDPKLVTRSQMESWVKQLENWGDCDCCCSVLFDKTPYAYDKAFQWSKRKAEVVKRAGFSLMAALAVHDKKAPDEKLAQFLPVIKRESIDERNLVKKGVNWALRQIGKRNKNLNRLAIEVGEEIRLIDSRSARWIASDALRELKSEQVQARLKQELALRRQL